jgi:hypothetical protein
VTDAQAGTGPESRSPDSASLASDGGGLAPDSNRIDSAGGNGQDAIRASDTSPPQTVAPDLPDIDDSPVEGTLTYIENSGYGQWPAFEIHTPMANYMLLKSQAAIVSILDSGSQEWINFSSGYRPNRGVPNLGGCCQPSSAEESGPVMTTVVDPKMMVTSTHVRFISKSADESFWLVWDFFLTHFTLTINRAAKPFGFTYQGVPGAGLDSGDQIAFSDGTVQRASNPRNRDLSGPAEWVYLTHPANKHSLFLLQHFDDALADPYRIADGDTPSFTFGGGQISQTPVRFSLGLIESCDARTVRKRIEFVRDAIR